MGCHEQATHRNIIIAGSPSVSFFLQLNQICGTSWMHQKTVPIVPRTVAATGMLVCAGIFACGGEFSGRSYRSRRKKENEREELEMQSSVRA